MGFVDRPGAISEAGALLIGEEYIFTARKRQKARKCEAFVVRASLAGKAVGGRDWD